MWAFAVRWYTVAGWYSHDIHVAYHSEERDKGAENCQLPNGDSVAIYQLVPVYTEEVLFKQANGIIPLLDKMKNVSYIVDTHRENTCRNFSVFEETGIVP